MEEQDQKTKMILDNLNLIYWVLKQWGIYDKRDQYYDLGLIGLVSAANRFESDKGYEFSTWAIACIKNEILKELRHENAQMRKAEKTVMSLDEDVRIRGNSGESISLAEVIPSDFNLEEYIIRKEQIEQLRAAIATLDEVDRKYISLYLAGAKQGEIAKELGLSQGYVSRKFKAIVRKLQERIMR